MRRRPPRAGVPVAGPHPAPALAAPRRRLGRHRRAGRLLACSRPGAPGLSTPLLYGLLTKPNPKPSNPTRSQALLVALDFVMPQSPSDPVVMFGQLIAFQDSSPSDPSHQNMPSRARTQTSSIAPERPFEC